MPKSIESSSEFDFSNGPSQMTQIAGSLAAVVQTSPSKAGPSRKFRHQNYSKNIYIGTKNAEKWETIRTSFSFKNDVEFVSYLLKLAEIDLADSNGYFKISLTVEISHFNP